MNHDAKFAANRLRGIALQIERGEVSFVDLLNREAMTAELRAVIGEMPMVNDELLVEALRHRAHELDPLP